MNDAKPITATAALASLLESRLIEWEKARKPQELKLLDCYMDSMRIPRDDDTVGTGQARSEKARGLFMGSTRNKIRSARAKINDALFGNGKFPLDTEPTNEKLKQFSDVVEDIIVDQLDRAKAKDMLTDGVDLLATYGTGFLFGPFVRKEVLKETDADNSSGMTQIVEREYEFDLPYFELGNTLDAYPDTEARAIQKALGVFWVTMESQHTVQAWAHEEGYQNVDQALLQPSGALDENGSEMAAQRRGNVEFWHKNERIKVARFFGKVPRKVLQEDDGGELPEEETSAGNQMVDIIAIMAGGVVVKVNESPYSGKMPVHRCVYEAVPNEIWGVGVAENNMAHQRMVNAAFRLYVENKGLALNPARSIDRSAFLPTEDFKQKPGKVYQFKPQLTPDQRKDAIIVHEVADVSAGWMDLIHMSEQFSDDDTGITKYTQGDDSSNLNKTASGISMIMSASSLPMKEVIQHIDSQWIEPMIECMIEWNLKYLTAETVQKIHGDKHAAAWEEIKRFGKSSFMTWKATGTKSFMTKEVLTNKIMTFINLVTAHPQFADKVDFIELLEQAWSLMEIGGESPILKDEGPEAIPPQVKGRMQQMEEMIKQLDSAIQGMHADLESKEIERYKAETERLSVEGNLALKAQAQAATPDVLLQEFAAIKEMLIDVMQGVKNPGHLAALPVPPQQEQPNEAAEPQPEAQEPPGRPEPAAMPAEQPEPPQGGFLTPEA